MKWVSSVRTWANITGQVQPIKVGGCAIYGRMTFVVVAVHSKIFVRPQMVAVCQRLTNSFHSEFIAILW